ncbi:MAG: uroporphyrinogen-III synthase [Candidatus Paracaedimonas acanthamoebae]|uniref:Uroporphyrinogen-III synthase n=1 Tax=Candidatus Paracaedimonas acanthamoebae TaxID=244581 RepID=A0A8J7PXL8_9PROT|nr:uroporphyrinogen-III synthase [Candidatus Paracaedimonas acanthamoebae]
MKVLLTRPQYDSQKLAKDLQDYGIESHINPLLEIEQKHFQYDPERAQAFVITSLNGLRSFATQNQERSLPLFVVGQESMNLASSFHFKKIIPGNGTALSLLPLIQTTCSPAEKEIACITGDYIHTDLILPLTELGFSAKQIIAYNTIECTSLDLQTQNFLKDKTISVVTFFSPRSAQIFAKLVENYKDLCQFLYGVCLSPEISNIVSEIKWRKLYTAASPSRQEIIEILKDLKKENIL